MDVRQRICNELAVVSHLNGSNSVPHLQKLLGYPPMSVHNALLQGLEDGKVEKYDRKKAIVKFSSSLSLEQLALTRQIEVLSEEIEFFMREANSRKVDATIEELGLQAGIHPQQPAVFTYPMLAVFHNPNLATYDLSPKHDKKTVYTFVTLKENLDKQWGEKQLEKEKK